MSPRRQAGKLMNSATQVHFLHTKPSLKWWITREVMYYIT